MNATPAPSKGQAIAEATEAVLDAAVQFREVESDPTHGTTTRAMAWGEFVRALMNYHMAELAIFAPEPKTEHQHELIALDGEAVWCKCGLYPERSNYDAMHTTVEAHVLLNGGRA